MSIVLFFSKNLLFNDIARLIWIFLISVFITNTAFSQNEFITTWKTDNMGTSNNSSIIIPTTGAGYNYDVDWDNDGVFDEFGVVGNVTHDFLIPGVYTIRIQGDFPRIYMNNSDDRRKIISIDQWGAIIWQSMQAAFWGANELIYNATDTPNLSAVTDVSMMFRGAILFNGNINSWNVSTVTNMSMMFRDANAFNNNINMWDVSNVTDMSSMFRGAILFNGNITNWNVSSVESMDRMFFAATSFNRDISLWNVSNVMNMGFMFRNATAFNQNIGGWDIMNVISMEEMLSNSGLSISNYDDTLIGWSTQMVQTNITLGATGLVYCSGAAARSSLISNHGWTIVGDNRSSVGFVR